MRRGGGREKEEVKNDMQLGRDSEEKSEEIMKGKCLRQNM